MPRSLVETLGRPIKSSPIPLADGSAQTITLSSETQRVSIAAVGGAIRYEIKNKAASESLSASATTSHWLADGERLDLQVPLGNVKLTVIRATGSSATAVEVTELS